MITASVRRRHATTMFKHKKQWNLHETYINSPWTLRGNFIKEDAIQPPGVDTGNMFETLVETRWKPSDALMQIDPKSIVN
jgi:hypothetical protein